MINENEIILNRVAEVDQQTDDFKNLINTIWNDYIFVLSEKSREIYIWAKTQKISDVHVKPILNWMVNLKAITPHREWNDIVNEIKQDLIDFVVMDEFND